MFREKFQNKLFTLFSSIGSQPLLGWIVKEKSGRIQQVKDEQLRSVVLDLQGNNVATTYVISPPPVHNSLGLRLRCVNLVVKYIEGQPFSFEIQILDDDGIRRRLRFSTYVSTARISMFSTVMGLKLTTGWNIVQLDLDQFTRQAFNTSYMETLKVQVHANCRIRRIYFSDRLYTDTDLPTDYRITIK